MSADDDGMIITTLDPIKFSVEKETQCRIFFSNELHVLANLVKKWGTEENDLEKIAYSMKLLYNFTFQSITDAFNKLKSIFEAGFSSEEWFTELHNKFFSKGEFKTGTIFRTNGLPKNQYEGVCLCLQKITDPLTKNFVVFVPMPEQSFNFFALRSISETNDDVGVSVEILKRITAIEQKVNQFEQPSRGRSSSIKRKPDVEISENLFAPPANRSRNNSLSSPNIPNVSFKDAVYKQRDDAEKLVRSSSRQFTESDSRTSQASNRKSKSKKTIIGNATVNSSTGFVTVGIVKSRGFKLTINNQIDLASLKEIMKNIDSPLKNYYENMKFEQFRSNAFRLIISDFPNNFNPMDTSYWPHGMAVEPWKGHLQPLEQMKLTPMKSFSIEPLHKDITDKAVEGLVLKAYQEDSACLSKIGDIEIKAERRESVPATQSADETDEEFERRKVKRAKQSRYVVQVKFNVSDPTFMVPDAISPYMQKTYPTSGVRVRTWKGLIPSEFKKRNERRGGGKADNFLLI